MLKSEFEKYKLGKVKNAPMQKQESRTHSKFYQIRIFYSRSLCVCACACFMLNFHKHFLIFSAIRIPTPFTIPLQPRHIIRAQVSCMLKAKIKNWHVLQCSSNTCTIGIEMVKIFVNFLFKLSLSS